MCSVAQKPKVQLKGDKRDGRHRGAKTKGLNVSVEKDRRPVGGSYFSESLATRGGDKLGGKAS